MDLLGEATSGTQVRTARLVSTDKVVDESNHHINSSLLCHSYDPHPDFGTYYSALDIYAWMLWGLGLAVLLAICTFYFLTIRSARKHWHEFICNVSVITSIYPIVAATAYISIVVPRSRMLGEAVAQQAVMVALYHFFRLVIAECGGVEPLIRSADGAHLETRLPPCCCWPCCIIPRPALRKNVVTWLHYIVLQVPIVQGIIYVLITVIWIEDAMLLRRVLMYFQPFVAASILSGMWGLIMLVTAATKLGFRPRLRLVSVQLALIIVKLQWASFKALPDIANLPCIVPLHPSITTNLIHNSLMMLEMLLISIWAWRLYSVPPGKDVGENEAKDKVVTVLEDSIRSIDVRSIKEGIDNKSFNNNNHTDN